MVLESIPVLSTAYLIVIAGLVLLVAGFLYRSDELSSYLLASGLFLLLVGVGMIVYFVSSFG